MRTAVPAATVLPAAGDWLTTWPIGTVGLNTCSIGLAVRFAALKVATALACGWLTTLGTSTELVTVSVYD